jgi:hypothetical protein
MLATVALGAAIIGGVTNGANGQSEVRRSLPLAPPTKPYYQAPVPRYPSTSNRPIATPKSTKPNTQKPIPRYPSKSNRPTASQKAPVQPVKFKVVWYRYERDSSGKLYRYGPYTRWALDTRRDAQHVADWFIAEGTKSSGYWYSASVESYYPKR